MTRKIPISVVVDPAVLEDLRSLSEHSSIPMAEFVRAAIDELLGEEEDHVIHAAVHCWRAGGDEET